ncbi:MAG: site-specific DNA-methyltransferase [Candidatus Kapabacteria bacterium]|jgi:site-specific DNA-methyltransferase (adenine-specific)|nr:site-specific DNA-methyltransferase [Candidatus Kapabacteria bacterium]
MNNTLITAHNLDVLSTMPSQTADLVLTSPPYFRQREYDHETPHEIGNETTEEEYLNSLLAVFRECFRVVKPTGSIVVNLGDKYLNGSLALMPYKFAIQATDLFGAKLINNITWTKLNPTPRQDKRKLVQSSEPFFLFVKDATQYYFDQDAFMEHLDALKAGNRAKPSNGLGKKYFDLIDESDLQPEEKSNARRELTMVIEEVKTGVIEGFRMKIRGVHAQPFGGQEGGRKIHIERDGFTIIRILGKTMKKDVIESPVEAIKGNPHPAVYPLYVVQQLIKLLTPENALVLDPFCGSGTTCVAAKMLGRRYCGIDISPKYIAYAEERLAAVQERELELFV